MASLWSERKDMAEAVSRDTIYLIAMGSHSSGGYRAQFLRMSLQEPAQKRPLLRN